jgi:bromodomain-containing protein 7/9
MDPVTEAIAPGYSAIIKQPMDFSTMDMKIKAGAYAGIDDYQRDFELMCNNALTYNEDTSVVYKAARKLLQQGLKVLQREKNSLQKAIDKLKKKRTVSKSRMYGCHACGCGCGCALTFRMLCAAANAGAGGGDAAGHATVDYSGMLPRVTMNG